MYIYDTNLSFRELAEEFICDQRMDNSFSFRSGEKVKRKGAMWWSDGKKSQNFSIFGEKHDVRRITNWTDQIRLFSLLHLRMVSEGIIRGFNEQPTTRQEGTKSNKMKTNRV